MKETRIYVDESAAVAVDAEIGPNTIISAGVTIGSGCRIGANVVIHPGTKIGAEVRIDDNTVVGKMPMRSVNSALAAAGDVPPCEIAERTLIGACVVIYAGCRIGEKVLVADQASIRENVTVGSFTIVGRGVAVENHCEIGSYVKLETNCYITAYSKIGDRAFIAPNVCTTNDNYLGRTKERLSKFKGVTVMKGARIGANATVLPGVTLFRDSLVAAGSVVTRDVPERKVALGVPARVVRDVPAEQLLENQ